ncbi:MAG: corrinoid protein [Chloroflexi bacterium]|jgi:5-methyltetrahydrofolate--homocysteine methyltransferase|nr:corrinoid protein [Chloroflexota bacterium]MBT4515901.1 corrinoid protein [Chloroflexota bacterium]MBT5320627.1 corrinoid protein [Chloroflexota bacterium]MBT6682967.1 corrinoid protein [Chloroflexota bacterium]
MDFNDLAQMVITGDHKGTESWTQEALESGVSPADIIDSGLIPGMEEVGRRFKAAEYHMPEVLISARAMKASLALVRPLVTSSGIEPKGRVAIGTVRGDLHDIGKNLVGMMLEGAGYEVNDLGANVSPEAFVDAVENGNADLIALSALLTTTMPMMNETIQALVQAEVRGNVGVMVGGAPVDQTYADRVGADGYAPDSATAVEVADALMKERAK